MDPIKILVIEDEIIIADTIVDAINELGYEALEPAINYSSAIEIIEVNELLKALINKMTFWDWNIAPEQITNTANLFWEEFYSANQHSFILPLPTDRRFKSFCKQVRTASFLAPALSTLANSVGASTKTITRLFKAETGMTYQEWRQQWRLFKAIELLSENRQVGDVAHQLEFSSNSAFIAFFKQQTGQTPLAFTKLGA